MLVKATLSLIDRRCPARDLPVTVSQIARGRTWDLFLLHAPDRDLLERGIRCWRDYVGEHAEVWSRAKTTAVVDGPNPHDSVLELMAAHRCRVLWPSYLSMTQAFYTVLAPSRDALRELVREIPTLENESLRVESVHEVPSSGLDITLPVSEIANGLTPRQLEVLVRAVQTGYFDTPRATSTQELSSEFSVSPSTLAEHLRKAERAALTTFTKLVTSYPALSTAAVKSRGRPPQALLDDGT